ncbi:unnamed protein product, partial [marine sediment metagenome]
MMFLNIGTLPLNYFGKDIFQGNFKMAAIKD